MKRTLKKVLSAVFQCAVILAFIGLFLYYVPWTTPIDVTLDAVKIDAEGNNLGTVQIHIHGEHRNYLFQEDQTELNIDPFDDLVSIQLSNGKVKSKLASGKDTTYWQSVFGAWNTSTSDTVFLMLFFTDEEDRLIFRSSAIGDSEDVYYFASVSGNYSPEQIAEHFSYINGLLPDLK